VLMSASFTSRIILHLVLAIFDVYISLTLSFPFIMYSTVVMIACFAFRVLEFYQIFTIVFLLYCFCK